MTNRKPMTALFLLKRLDCDNGVTSYCETIMQGVKEAGDRVIVVTGPISVTPATQQRLDAMKNAAVEWLLLPSIGRQASIWQSFKIILEIIKRQNVDVLCPQGFKMLPLSKLLSLRTSTPIVANFHGGAASHVGKEGSLKEKLYYASVPKLFGAKKFISMSRETSQFMMNICGINPARMVTIPYGVDVKYFRLPSASERHDARAKYDLKENSLVCVLPGWVSIDKGHNLVVDAVRSLRQTHPEIPINCLFAGSTERGAEIVERSHKDQQDRETFRFLGFVGREQLRQAYWAADIVLLPSLIEGFAIAVAEAMACGCIAIRTPAGGCADQIIDGVTGFVVPFRDAAAIAVKISALNDWERRLEMRESARQHVLANFNKDDMVSHTIDIYRMSFGGT
jgi:glycosyltransferase involved in cell wall biosynthesis